MSYDLYFYKKKNSELLEKDIRDYLRTELTEPNEQNNQWWFDNEDTGVYFCFEATDAEDSDDYKELFESFSEFDNMGFLFNLNFIRPEFFGLEAFLFVEKFIEDLDLYVLNTQSEKSSHIPYKPERNELYQKLVKDKFLCEPRTFFRREFFLPFK